MACKEGNKEETTAFHKAHCCFSGLTKTTWMIQQNVVWIDEAKMEVSGFSEECSVWRKQNYNPAKQPHSNFVTWQWEQCNHLGSVNSAIVWENVKVLSVI